MSLNWSRFEKFLRRFEKKKFRDTYAAARTRTSIALQIRALREQPDRNWSQAELGRRAGKPQSNIARLENPDYGQVTLQTLIEIAAAFDVAPLFQFVEWEDWYERMADVSPGKLGKRPFEVDRFVALARVGHSSMSAAVASGKMANIAGGQVSGASPTAPANPLMGDVPSLILAKQMGISAAPNSQYTKSVSATAPLTVATAA